jgi:hypothetical protein
MVRGEQPLMESAPNPKSKAMNKNTPPVRTSLFVGFFTFLTASVLPVDAADTSTNWAWLDIQLSIPQTNFVLGSSMPVSIVISNTSDHENHVHWLGINNCSCGFAHFSIMEISSGKQVECKIPSYNWSIIDANDPKIAPHDSKAFNFDLAGGYDFTNSGPYKVEVVGTFPLSSVPTVYTNLNTPPIDIFLTPNVKPQAIK